MKEPLEKGEAQRRSAEGLLVVRWMDRKAVNTISSKHSDIDFTSTGKMSRPTRDKPPTTIMKPKQIIEYNQGMLAVDRQDQVLSYNPVMRRYVKGYVKIFFYLFEVSMFNSFVVYKKLSGKSKQHFSEYKTNLAEQITQSIRLRPRTSPGRPSTSNPMRLQGRLHFPMTIPATPSKPMPTKRCLVCSSKGLRREVRIQCSKCVVPLHIDGCFEAYHTLVNY